LGSAGFAASANGTIIGIEYSKRKGGVMMTFPFDLKFPNNELSPDLDDSVISKKSDLRAVVSEMTHRMIFIETHPFFLLHF